jgi:hypothetical protein
MTILTTLSWSSVRRRANSSLVCDLVRFTPASDLSRPGNDVSLDLLEPRLRLFHGELVVSARLLKHLPARCDARRVPRGVTVSTSGSSNSSAAAKSWAVTALTNCRARSTRLDCTAGILERENTLKREAPRDERSHPLPSESFRGRTPLRDGSYPYIRDVEALRFLPTARSGPRQVKDGTRSLGRCA